MRLPSIAQVAIFTELVRKKLPAGLQDKGIVDNIANKRSFSLRMLGSPKYNEKTEEHVRIKKAICPKDGSIFDFMIRSPNDESEIIDNSPLLAVPETESVKYANISNETTISEFELVETLLQEASIEGYNPHIHLKIFLINFHYRVSLHHTIQYVTENMIVIMHILFEIKNPTAFSATGQTMIGNRLQKTFEKTYY